MAKHKYILTIEFETEIPVKKVSDTFIQFENGLPYFVESTPSQNESVNNSFVYGSGKTKLKKVQK